MESSSPDAMFLTNVLRTLDNFPNFPERSGRMACDRPDSDISSWFLLPDPFAKNFTCPAELSNQPSSQKWFTDSTDFLQLVKQTIFFLGLLRRSLASEITLHDFSWQQ
jgi:hypothetical protein